jgi:hypothetical protein
MASGRRIRCGHNNRKNTVDQEVDRTKQGRESTTAVVHEGCSWLKGPCGQILHQPAHGLGRADPPQKFGIGTA